MKRFLNLVWLLSFTLSSGCVVTKFNSIPTTPFEFQLSHQKIRAQFPDVIRYEKKFDLSDFGAPRVDDLIEQWGDPIKVRKDWGLYWGIAGGTGLSVITGVTPASMLIVAGVALVMNPFPRYEYYWVKGNFCIKALVGKSVFHYYQSVVLFWEWYLLENEPSPPCTSFQSETEKG